MRVSKHTTRQPRQESPPCCPERARLAAQCHARAQRTSSSHARVALGVSATARGVSATAAARAEKAVCPRAHLAREGAANRHAMLGRRAHAVRLTPPHTHTPLLHLNAAREPAAAPREPRAPAPKHCTEARPAASGPPGIPLPACRRRGALGGARTHPPRTRPTWRRRGAAQRRARRAKNAPQTAHA